MKSPKAIALPGVSFRLPGVVHKEPQRTREHVGVHLRLFVLLCSERSSHTRAIMASCEAAQNMGWNVCGGCAAEHVCLPVAFIQTSVVAYVPDSLAREESCRGRFDASSFPPVDGDQHGRQQQEVGKQREADRQRDQEAQRPADSEP